MANVILPPPQLDYAPAPPLHRSAAVRRWARVALIVGLFVGIVWISPRIIQRLRLLRLQQQWMRYSAPPSEVVYENDPAEMTRLLAAPSRYLRSTNQPHFAYRVPDVPQLFGQIGFGEAAGTVFAHRMITKQSVERLVHVQLYHMASISPWGSVDIELSACPYEPASFYRPLRSRHGRTARGDGSWIRISPGDTLRIFAGQMDPKDPSHFTVDYLLNGVRHTVDGWLTDEATVIIESRD